MTTDRKFNEVPVTEVRTVTEFEEVKNRLRAFKDSNPDFFKYLEPLIEEYNTKLQAAEKDVRARAVSCGDFHLYQQYVTYDTDALFNALGRDGFLAVGGTEKTVTKYEVDKKRLEVAAKSGQVPAEALRLASKTEHRYHKPAKIDLP